VAHPSYPCYSEGRDQDDHSSKPVRANSSERPYLEKPFTKTELAEWLKAMALSSSSSTTKKNLKIDLSYDRVIPLLEIYSKESE
jgi:hypothetical protein